MIYLDNAATTPLDSTIFKRMKLYFTQEYGNASSVHSFGRDARMAVERARQQVADGLGAQQKEIVFTSSASEANNLAIKGVIEKFASLARNDTIEVVASPIEHPCVMEALRHVERNGWAKIMWLPVSQQGLVAVEDVKHAISERTVLVSVMYVNNEIGTVQPVKEIGDLVKQERKRRGEKLLRDKDQLLQLGSITQRDSSQVLLRKTAQDDNTDVRSLPIYFHTDAVQAFQYLDCNVDSLGVDLLSVAAHKMYGPKGVGMLYVRNGVQLVRQIDGGGQEYYVRAGTENVAGIVGVGEAVKMLDVKQKTVETERLRELQSYLISAVLEQVSEVQLTGHASLRAPHISSFIFDDVDPEALVIALDRRGFAVSSGSACSSGVVKQSHVIDALMLDVSKKAAALRVSTGRFTQKSELEEFVKLLKETVTMLREMRI